MLSIRESRLYYDNSYLERFESVVRAVREDDSGAWVRLEQSAFYPSSGGQPHDIGMLGNVPVIEVTADEDGVWHRIDGALSVGNEVIGQIDWRRRFDFMQQHCGQHILSACFEQLLGASTSSFHMGDLYSSIDLDIADLTLEALTGVVEQANQWIWSDVPVRARFVSGSDLEKLRLRKPPAVERDIRIVTIEGLEDNACGGTHPSSTGQVGQILTTKVERMRGGVRVTFVCGQRAVHVASELVEVVRQLSNRLSVGAPELGSAVGSLQEQVRSAGRREQTLRNRIAETLGAEFARNADRDVSGVTIVTASLGTLDDVADLKRTATAVQAQFETLDAVAGDAQARAGGEVVALVGQAGERAHILIETRSSGGTVEANAVIREILAMVNGKGGGNAKAAQGSAVTSAAELLSAARTVLRNR